MAPARAWQSLVPLSQAQPLVLGWLSLPLLSLATTSAQLLFLTVLWLLFLRLGTLLSQEVLKDIRPDFHSTPRFGEELWSCREMDEMWEVP